MMEGNVWQIVSLSLRVAGIAIIVALPVAFVVAWVLARFNFPGKSLAQAIVTMPLVLPPVVTGYLLLILFGARGAVGAPLQEWFGLSFSFRWTGAALAAGVMAFPLLVRPIRLSIEGLDRGLEEAARTLGASRFTAFFTVVLPPLLPGVLAGAVLGFAKALGEFGATITFVSNIPGETQTLSLAIYALMQIPSGDAEAFRLIAISAAISVAAVVLSEWLQRRLAGVTK
ncbi:MULTISPECIES: molybdate ABC transporter permease subunit [Brucella/Ochrobactrum group]|jgi:molybdate transport system permease protein|uniref:Molybdenum transport system permease n=1 Tax=Brucella pseudintermedia TaxID=370111 RepID=A0ABY5UDX2_9HYPH|nr:MULTISPECIES: molybdate ABC transporter permease subunit [Brucella/Ochrobactrum group]KAB2683031.1 molybdate ABC transporter permease subunit [Brucella pseudintermedia]MCO7727297.1 molybdate ABC transporter permease subunit [Brucella intermedia]NKE74361.1 molybdate ABC transporter permease subunit [Ochrobactrum sp. MC-1LL]TWH04587.1 molybdate transport system permease protein [Ochrobactrum sp. J50]UWL61540.1 molybdate ABC transporter permease subunit [Brucella pseudintermedia]